MTTDAMIMTMTIDGDEAVSPQSCRIGNTFMCTGLKTTIRVGSSFAVHVTVTSALDRHLAGISVITVSRLPGMHGQFNLVKVYSTAILFCANDTLFRI